MLKYLSRISAIILLFTALLIVQGCGDGNYVDITRPNEISFFSESRGKIVRQYVLFPERYKQRSKSYPVLYLLHGAYGSYHDWVEKTALFNISRKYDLIIVLPDGDPFGWYLDSPLVDSSRIETYLTGELIGYIDSHYRTIKHRKGRGICGLSMGGHGAFTLGAHHPELFYTISSLSGVMDISRHRSQWDLSELIPSENDSLWGYYSALQSCFRFNPGYTPGGFKLMFDVGEDDFTFAENLDLHHALDSLGIEHDFYVYPGTHSWQYWGEHIETHLIFHSKYLLKPE